MARNAVQRIRRLLWLSGAVALWGCSPGFKFSFAPPPTYEVGGRVSGLVGSGLTLTRNGSVIGRGANGTYPDLGPGPLLAGQSYDLAVITQPANPAQTCVVANGQGTIGNSDVTNVQVTCTTSASRFVYVADGGSSDLRIYAIDENSGSLQLNATVPVAQAGPYFLALDRNSQYLYVANAGSNSVSAYSIDATSGALSPVVGSPFPAGRNPNSAAVHPGNALVYVTNQADATVSAYSLDPATGALAPVAGSPFATGSSPTSVLVPDLSNPLLDSYLYVSAGGNNVWIYTIAAAGTQAVALTGALTPAPGSPVAVGTNPSCLVADPAVNLIYATEAGDNAVSAYFGSPATGALAAVTGSPFTTGANPTFAAIDPSGRFAYVSGNADNTVSAYQISAGALQALAGSPFATGAGPGSMAVDNLDRFLYVVNSRANSISAYAIGASGALTPVAGSPFPSGSGPTSIVVSH